MYNIMLEKTTYILIVTLFTLSVIESFRFLTVLFPIAYRHRLSCYFTHLVTLACWILLSLHILSYFDGDSGVIKSQDNLFVYNQTLLTISKLSDMIAIMFSVLMVAFSKNKSNIITPLENEKVDAWRIISNVYLHYGPSIIFWAIRVINPLSFDNDVIINYDISLYISSGIVILWTILYWGEVDACYGLKYKGDKRGGGNVRDLIVPYIMVVVIPYLCVRKNFGW